MLIGRSISRCILCINFVFRPSRGVKYCGQRVCMLVCLFVCLSACRSARISQKTRPNFTKFSVHVTCGFGSVLLWRKRNTLRTTGFVDDVMFSHNGAYQWLGVSGHRHSPPVWAISTCLWGEGDVCRLHCLLCFYMFAHEKLLFYFVTLFKSLLVLYFQDEKDQIITTNCWLNQVLLNLYWRASNNEWIRSWTRILYPIIQFRYFCTIT